ncbi:MAG: SIMPL domain-containing protein [Pelolinea sp.]|nr:SIMPL domain-containing protein [Pelolinea sp.]
MKSNKLLIGILLVVLVALAACAPAAVTGGGTSNEPVPQISVVGSGLVYITPDIAYINVGVRSQADTVAAALELNNTQAKAIKETLMGQGVDEKDIQTSSFNVYPQSDYDTQGQIVRTYFSVENNVYVTVRNLDSIGKVLDAVAKSGANNIYGITFDVQDKTEAQSSARKLAIDSARTQAQELAAAAGVELGEIIMINSSLGYTQPYTGYGKGGGGGEGALSPAVPIAAGQMQVTSDVTMSFAIKQELP